jgi:molecular chaperone GrpE
MIQKQFEDLLFKKYGVEKYGEAGEEFNPERHQAVMMEVGDYKEETVVEVFRSGYALHERVIRPAQVKVGKPE